MTEHQSSYRQIMKATSIFGGVQMINIIISIIRSKFIAVLLGPLGLGIVGLLTSTTGLITNLTNFGLGTSSVKDIAVAFGTGNVTRVSIVVTVFRRLVWITGMLGLILTITLSPLLSQLTFGNEDYTWAFIFISITLLVNQISTGQNVLLQGMRKISYLAKSTMIGSLIGLLTSIPLYYLYGIKGIVPALIVSSFTAFFISWYFANKLNLKPIYVSKLRTIAEGKGMLKMGFMISMSGLITVFASYIVRIFISNTGGVEQVGLYNAGFIIINSYVGLIFSAMSTDYYPRLSSVAHSNEKSKEVINQQAEIALLILAPIIMFFLVFINWMVILLYSTQFIPVNEMILYAALGMFFKAASWSIAFIFLAKGASKLFFWNELIANIYTLALNLIGYKLLGLTGLGMSFLLAYFLYLIQVFVVSRAKYDFVFTSSFYRVFGLQFLLAVICFAIVKFSDSFNSYAIGSLIIAISAYMAFKEMDKRLDLQSILHSKRFKT
jgi:O-antigen/teichoic acid export membrane protein